MTETIDSNQKKLPLSQIVMYAVQRASEAGELPQGATIPAALASITAEGSMPDTDIKQIGNTVYISHYSKDKLETSTRAFNMDSARNFVENTIAYAAYLANNNVKRITVDFKGEQIKQMLLMVAKSPMAQQFWGMQIFKSATGGYRAYINLQRTN